MPTATAAARRGASRQMKGPLAVTGYHPSDGALAGGTASPPPDAGFAPRAATLAEFAHYLRTITNRDGRPFQPPPSTPTSSLVAHWIHG